MYDVEVDVPVHVDEPTGEMNAVVHSIHENLTSLQIGEILETGYDQRVSLIKLTPGWTISWKNYVLNDQHDWTEDRDRAEIFSFETALKLASRAYGQIVTANEETLRHMLVTIP